MNPEALFEEVGFIGEYRSKFEAFYRPYFENENSLLDFFVSVFENDSTDKKPRWMMNHILWYVSLANDIDKIRPGRDPLRILFFRICLESICKIVGSNNKRFFDTFDTFFSEEGKQYILSHFVFSGIMVPDELSGLDRALFDTHEDYSLTCADVLSIIRETRNMVAHDGDYWSMQVFAHDTDSEWIATMTTDQQLISCQPKGETLTYYFHTTMQYEMFEYYFVEACLNYLRNYIEREHDAV